MLARQALLFWAYQRASVEALDENNLQLEIPISKDIAPSSSNLPEVVEEEVDFVLGEIDPAIERNYPTPEGIPPQYEYLEGMPDIYTDSPDERYERQVLRERRLKKNAQKILTQEHSFLMTELKKTVSLIYSYRLLRQDRLLRPGGQVYFATLNNDIFSYLLNFCEPYSLVQIARTNRALYACINRNSRLSLKIDVFSLLYKNNKIFSGQVFLENISKARKTGSAYRIEERALGLHKIIQILVSKPDLYTFKRTNYQDKIKNDDYLKRSKISVFGQLLPAVIKNRSPFLLHNSAYLLSKFSDEERIFLIALDQIIEKTYKELSGLILLIYCGNITHSWGEWKVRTLNVPYDLVGANLSDTNCLNSPLEYKAFRSLLEGGTVNCRGNLYSIWKPRKYPT